MTLVDLTAELAHGMVRHPAPHLPPVEVVPVATHEVEKRSVQKVTFGTHVSTRLCSAVGLSPGGEFRLVSGEYGINAHAVYGLNGGDPDTRCYAV